jgi:hypothetical protein
VGHRFPAPQLSRYATHMEKIIHIFIKISAIYLLAVGVFLLLKEQFYPDFKFGPTAWWFTVICIIGAAIPATALFFVPESKGFKRIHKITIGIVIAPPLIIFSVNTYDCLLSVYQDRYREGLFYILSLSVGTAACLLGYFILFLKSFNNNSTRHNKSLESDA